MEESSGNSAVQRSSERAWKNKGGVSRAGKEIQPGHVLTIVSLTGLLDICLAVLTSGQESPPRVTVPPEQVNPGTIFQGHHRCIPGLALPNRTVIVKKHKQE